LIGFNEPREVTSTFKMLSAIKVCSLFTWTFSHRFGSLRTEIFNSNKG